MNVAVILAAGKGTRMSDNSVPKQFAKIGDKLLIEYSLEAFSSCREIDEIIIVTSFKYLRLVQDIVAKNKLNKVSVIEGGDTRQQSSFKAMKHLYRNCTNSDIILIHDAARPFINETIILNNIEVAKKNGAAVTAIPIHDTVIESFNGQSVDCFVNRELLYIIQTPQSFRFKKIFDAHQWAITKNITNASDDAQLLLDIGEKVTIVSGSKFNFKVTTFDDFMLATSLLKK